MPWARSRRSASAAPAFVEIVGETLPEHRVAAPDRRGLRLTQLEGGREQTLLGAVV